ncbi:hypothetical protein [Micromonospora aurantiaca (nom. illeg.)]|uniref:hypothetical protein n=1 Tax=Micromonospora aurantiaca (nom. illeg.) TaxID=47850 RepID=UPI003F4A5E0E
MRTLPIALPQCGEPAAVRIEVYSAGSLDASAYACPAHVELASSAVDRAGFTAHVVTLAPDVRRPCGHVHVYPTGRLADSDEPQHPHWCDRRDCAGRGLHRSVRLPVNGGHPDPTICELTLTQHLTLGDPVLTLTVIDGGGQELALSLGQGCVLAYQVRRLLDLAKAGQR